MSNSQLLIYVADTVSPSIIYLWFISIQITKKQLNNYLSSQLDTDGLTRQMLLLSWIYFASHENKKSRRNGVTNQFDFGSNFDQIIQIESFSFPDEQ